MSSSSQAEAALQRRWLAALLRGRCPRCRDGKVFRGSVSMYPTCPHCGLRFEREQGYFVGAMYISYFAAVVVLTLLFWAVSLFEPSLSFEAALVAATVLFLPFVPAVFRYSRLLWMYVDRAIDPPA
jgi:uncharacterized protein (DUF983 family)